MRRAWLAGLLLLTGTQAAHADVSDVVITDVTTRAFSVVWVSDEAVLDYGLRVFDDENGLTPVTSVSLEKLAGDAATARGLVKVDVTGLEPDHTYYVQSVTDSATGQYLSPAVAPFLAATTATRTTKVGAQDQPIVNDLLLHNIFGPDGVSTAPGALLLIKLPDYSDYPLSAFVGDGVELPAAIIDLNNLFDRVGGVSAETGGGEMMEVVEVRGVVGTGCSRDNHKLVRTRRVPIHEEDPAITELEVPAACFSPDGVVADFDCNGFVGLVDVGKIVAQFGRQTPDCSFNPDYDLNSDGFVGLQDIGQFVSVFGRSE